MFFKDLFTLIKASFNRFIFLLCIVLIGVGFLMGLSITSPIMMKSVDDYYNTSNYRDLKLYSNFGFCDEDIERLKEEEYIKDVLPSKEVDAYARAFDSNTYVIRFQEINSTINDAELINGRLPQRSDECIISDIHRFGLGIDINDVIGTYINVFLEDGDINDSLKNTRYRIVGSFNSPEYMSKILTSSNLDNKQLSTIVLINDDNFVSDYYTCLNVTFKDSNSFNSFKDSYKEYTDECINSIETLAIKQKEVCKNKIVSEALEEIKDGEKELADEKAKGEKDLKKAKKELDDALDELKDGEQKIVDGENEIKDNEKKISDNENELNNQSNELNTNISNIESSYGKSLDELYLETSQAYDDYVSLTESKTTHVIKQSILDSDPTLQPTYDSLIAGLPGTQTAFDTFVDGILAVYDSNFGGSLNTIYTGIKTLYDGRNAINNGYKQISDAKKQIEDAKEEIEENKKKIKDGWDDYNKGIKEYKDGVEEFNEKIADAQKEIDDAYKEIEDLKDPKWILLDRTLDYPYALYKGSCEQIGKIAMIMPLLFFLVGILVCITTMTRLIQEQRTQIGIYRAIGYSKNVVIFKYICYAFFSSIIGSGLGIVIGSIIFPSVIYNTWRLMYVLPKMKFIIPIKELLISLFSFTIIMVIVTYFVVKDTLKEKPSDLLRPKAPKSSKPIILERIRFIWDKVSFTSKVTFRNIVRYKARFFMTVIGVAGCTGLLVLGFGIKDSISDVVEIQYNDFFRYNYIGNLKDGINEDEFKESITYIKDNKNINYSSPYYEYASKVHFDKEDKPINVEVFDINDFSNSFNLINYKTGNKIELNNEGVIITEKFSINNRLKEGDSISFESADGSIKSVKISQICKTYFQHTLYMSNALYDDLFNEEYVPNKIAISYNNSLEELDRLIDNEHIVSVTDFSSFISSFEQMITSLDLIVLVIILTAGSLAFVVLFNLIEVNIAERIREIATLKVLGFRRNEIYYYIFKEILLLTVIGGVIGLFLGNYEVKLVMNIINIENMMFSCDVKLMSYIYSFAITILFTIIVLFFTRRTLNNIKMAESLKSVE